MNGNVNLLAARNMGRPVLMERGALESWIARIHAVDARAFERPSRISALMRKLSGARQDARVMEDDDAPPPVPMDRALAYSPRYIGEPDDAGYCWTLKSGIALMCANTPLLSEGDRYCGTVFHGYDTMLDGMREAAADARVKAIFFKLDTPGGVADGGLMTLAKWVRENRASAGGKTIWMYAKTACSAGYWFCAGGDKIIAPEMGYVGSTSCYILHWDYSGAYAQLGIVATDIAADEKKTDGADWKPLSEGARADLLADVMQIRNYFHADVNASRPRLSIEALVATKGAAYMTNHSDPAYSGLALGFVDEIASEEEAFAALLAEVTTPAAAGRGVRAFVDPMTSAVTGLVETTLEAVATSAKVADGAPTKDDEEVKPEETPPEDVPAEPAQGPAAEPESEEDDGDDDESSQIAASAEAAAEPELALVAIRSGMTLVQFQAQVKAVSDRPRANGALARVMANAPRLGPDTGKEGSSSSMFGDALLADAKKRSAAKR